MLYIKIVIFCSNKFARNSLKKLPFSLSCCATLCPLNHHNLANKEKDFVYTESVK